MNWIDLSVYIIIFLFLLIGLSRGFLRQLFSVLAIIGGIIVAVIFYDVFAMMFIRDNLVNNESIANVGAFLIVGFISYLIIQFLGWITTKLMGSIQLGWLNRLAGAAVGVVIGIIASFLFVSTATFFVSEDSPTVAESTTIPYLNSTYEKIKNSMPEDLKASLINSRELIRKEGLEAAMRIKDSDKIKEILDNEQQ